MRQNLNDIVVNELQAEHDEIIKYRQAVASGIEDYEDEVLDDAELTNAFERVISYYKNKYVDYDPLDNSFAAGPGYEFYDTIEFGDIQFGDGLEINDGTSNDSK